MKIYIAAPLFSEGERAFNEKIDGFDNVMLCGAPEAVLRNEEELRKYLLKLKAAE